MAEKVANIVGKKNKFLRLISGGEELIIDECDGSRVIANAKRTFTHIDSDFKNWGIEKKGSATKKTPVRVYEMERSGTFSQIFSSLSFDPRKVCLTQDQILGFTRKYRDWLRLDECGTFFLFPSKSKEYFFVARIYFYSDDDLEVYVNQLWDGSVWSAEYRPRVVVPWLV